jgi:hypothetical protein
VQDLTVNLHVAVNAIVIIVAVGMDAQTADQNRKNHQHGAGKNEELELF